MTLDLQKAQRIQIKIAELTKLLTDPDLAPILPFVLGQHSQGNVAPSRNGHKPLSIKNPTYTGVREAIRKLSDKLPNRFTRSQIMDQFREQNFSASDDSIKDALYALSKAGEIRRAIRGRGGLQNQYEFVRQS